MSGEKDRERETETERDREASMYVCTVVPADVSALTALNGNRHTGCKELLE